MTKKAADELGELRISGTKRLAPTPDILDALEQDYPIEASVADLVDNSIDARAKTVLIRFRRRGRRLVGLCVADNGYGITASHIDHAMRFADKRKYGPKDLGMYGVSLKTASLSQAEVVTVLSRADGARAVGRQWSKTQIKKMDWSINLITEESAANQLERRWGELGRIRRGTVIRWDKVVDFDRLREGVDAYIERVKTKMQVHLGLKLHRFLEKGRIRIFIDVEDIATGEVGPPSVVAPLNPFPPPELSALKGYPKTFVAVLPEVGRLKLVAHVWRKKSKSAGYRLGGGKVADHQGLYFFRHGRLISDGGWYGLRGTNEPHLSLARVEVDIPDELSSYLKVTPNKSGVDAPASFSHALEHAVAADKARFKEFLKLAEQVARERGEQKARALLQPGDGIPADVKSELDKRGTKYLRGLPLTITWGRLKQEKFFDVDLGERRVVLNAKYRPILLRGAHGGKTDVPLVRTLLYFTLESLLSGERIGKVEGLRLKEIQAAMTAAMKAEARWASE